MFECHSVKEHKDALVRDCGEYALILSPEDSEEKILITGDLIQNVSACVREHTYIHTRS